MTTFAFSQGDRVKLTARYADVLNRSFHARLDWKTRQGVVTRCNNSDVTIRWDGRETLDAIPVRGVEKLECTE